MKVMQHLMIVMLLCSCSHNRTSPVAPVALESQYFYRAFKPPFDESTNLPVMRDTAYHHFYLDNGLTVYLIPQPHALYTHIKLVVGHGKSYQHTLTTLLGEFLPIGSRRLGKKQFLTRMAALGSELSFNHGTDYSELAMSVLEQDLDPALSLLAQAVTEPFIEASHLTKARRSMALKQLAQQSLGSSQAYRSFLQLLYPEEHPYRAKPVNDNLARSVTIEQLHQYYKQNYSPQSASLILSGRLSVDELTPVVEQHFNAWRSTDMPEPMPARDIPHLTGNNLFVIDRSNAKQVNIISGFIGVNRAHKDWTHLYFLSKVLGGGSHSRLFNDVREHRGLAYAISSTFSSRKQAAPFYIRTSTAHHKVAAMLHALEQHKRHLVEHPIADEELALHKAHILGSLSYGRETPEAMAAQRRARIIQHLPDDTSKQFGRIISNISSTQLLGTAKRYMSGQWVTLIVGDFDKIEKQLETYFPAVNTIRLEASNIKHFNHY